MWELTVRALTASSIFSLVCWSRDFLLDIRCLPPPITRIGHASLLSRPFEPSSWTPAPAILQGLPAIPLSSGLRPSRCFCLSSACHLVRLLCTFSRCLLSSLEFVYCLWFWGFQLAASLHILSLSYSWAPILCFHQWIAWSPASWLKDRSSHLMMGQCSLLLSPA